MERKIEMIEYLKSFIGSSYSWGKEGGFNVGFDCSGFVLEGLKSCGMWKHDDASSQMIFNRFKKVNPLNVSVPKIGDLAFFGKDVDSISHIAFMINENHILEAGGGGKDSVDKGMVRIRPLSWRKDLVSIVRIPNDYLAP